MSHECNYCKRSFSTNHNLIFHQKTAKFCLDIQNNNCSSAVKEELMCEYCNKLFTTKPNLNTHLGTCKAKQEHDKLAHQRLQYELELEKERLEYRSKLEKERAQYTIELNKIISEKDKQNELLQQEVRMLKEQLSSKHTEFVTVIDKLSQSKQVVINDNSTNTNTNNYTFQYNKMVEQLLPYTDENISRQFGQISTIEIRSDINKMEDTFISQFSKHMSSFAFCTDPSRGRLVTKDEDGKPVKRLAEHVVLDCLIKCKKEINIMVNDIGYRLDQDYDEGKIDSEVYRDFTLQHAYLHDYLKTHRDTVTPYIKKLSNIYSRTCQQFQKSIT